MTVRYLLDTNILSEPVRPRRDAQVVRALRERGGELATTSVVWHELVFGVSRLPPSRRRRELERYLQEVVGAAVPILPYDAAAAEWHGEERARLAALGISPPFADGQIAAVAAVRGLILVTRNARDFEFFEGVEVERWHGDP